MRCVFLSINEQKKIATDIVYDDLVMLYFQFINKYNKIPTVKEMTSKYNMPQQRIINRVLLENNITYNDFLLQFGKVSHVRTENKDCYNDYVKKFKDICKKENRTLKMNELINNKYGLPSYNWFIKYCPDQSVKTYNDFIIWCGLNSNKIKWEKDDVKKILLDYESRLGRPLVRSDINSKTLGFSNIVINRLYGTFDNCKKEIGLKKTIIINYVDFNVYKSKLDYAINEIKKNNNTGYITWDDLSKYDIKNKSIVKAFKRENMDFYAYLKSNGLMINTSLFSFHYTFDDGERILSNYEYLFSSLLKDNGFKYNVDYYKDYMYSLFTDIKGRFTCDYYINNVVVEIAGIIDNKDNNWKNKDYKSKKKNDYRDNLLHKINKLDEFNIPYILLFSDDFSNENYKSSINKLLDNKSLSNL